MLMLVLMNKTWHFFKNMMYWMSNLCNNIGLLISFPHNGHYWNESSTRRKRSDKVTNCIKWRTTFIQINWFHLWKQKIESNIISSSILPTDVCWLQVKVFDYDEFYFLSFCLFHWKQFPYDFYVNIFSWNWTVTLKLNTSYTLFSDNQKSQHLLTEIWESSGGRKWMTL